MSLNLKQLQQLQEFKFSIIKGYNFHKFLSIKFSNKNHPLQDLSDNKLLKNQDQFNMHVLLLTKNKY